MRNNDLAVLELDEEEDAAPAGATVGGELVALEGSETGGEVEDAEEEDE